MRTGLCIALVFVLACPASMAWGQARVHTGRVVNGAAAQAVPGSPVSAVSGAGVLSNTRLSPAGSIGLTRSVLPGIDAPVLTHGTEDSAGSMLLAQPEDADASAAAPEQSKSASERGPPAGKTVSESAADKEAPAGTRTPADESVFSQKDEVDGSDPASANGLREIAEAEESASGQRALFDGAAAGKKLRITMAASEAVPFVKTGGLADVVGSLSPALAEAGHQVSLFLPKYGRLKFDKSGFTPDGHKLERIPGSFKVPMGPDGERTTTLLKTHVNGVDVYFVEHDELFAGDEIYGYHDDIRFVYFSRAVIEASKHLKLETDVFHVHDWHTALIPAMLKSLYKDDPLFRGAATVLSLHNLAFQGSFIADTILSAGFDWDDLDEYGHFGAFNLLRAGLMTADKLVAVSQNYVRETLTPEFGHSLEEVLLARLGDYTGITNGVDLKEWDTLNDPLIRGHYSTDDAAAGKAINKRSFQRRFGLDQNPNAPLFAAVARISHQKGLDLVMQAVKDLVAKGGQLALLGSAFPGDEHGEAVERSIKKLAKEHPGQIWYHPFDLDLPHILMAASDFFLMPSRFEPCGLTQQFAMLYGSIPIVTSVGGLVDTVRDVRRAGGGTGIVVGRPNVANVTEGVRRAFGLYQAGMAQVIRNAMSRDASWAAVVPDYVKVYLEAMAKPKS